MTRRDVAQATQGLHAVEIGEFEVEQDDVRRQPVEHVGDAVHALDVADDLDVGLCFENMFYAEPDYRVVIHDQRAYGFLVSVRHFRFLGSRQFPCRRGYALRVAAPPEPALRSTSSCSSRIAFVSILSDDSKVLRGRTFT
jgi:hypothetical protein